jgi:hypothetical protein
MYPATQDFVYLRAAAAAAAAGPAGSAAAAAGWPNPYALRVVPFAALRGDARAAADYYTLSVRGLTRYVDGESAEFTSERRARAARVGVCAFRGVATGWGRRRPAAGRCARSGPAPSPARHNPKPNKAPAPRPHRPALDQWEREVSLYVGLRQLPVFHQHRPAKALAAWRRAVRGAKAAKARAALGGGGAGGAAAGGVGGGGLYVLSPAFQAPLRRVWALCCEVAALRLHVLRDGQVGGRHGSAGKPPCRGEREGILRG